MSARDFVYVSKKGYDGAVFVMGGQSVEFPDAPAKGKIVRAHNGPGCQMVTPTSDRAVCHFTWLMDCDYKVRTSRPPLSVLNLLHISPGMDASKYSGCSNARGSDPTH